MAARQRKLTDKKRPVFKVTKPDQEPEEQDLKKVKAQIIKELEENKEKDKEWYDKELAKNLK